MYVVNKCLLHYHFNSLFQTPICFCPKCICSSGSYFEFKRKRFVGVPKYSKQSLQFPLPFLEIHSTQPKRRAPMKRLIQSVISIHRSNLRKRLRTLGIGTITSPFSRNRWSVVSLNPILLIHLDVLQ